MIKTRLFTSLISITTILLLSPYAYACACGPRPTVLFGFEISDLVVTARIASIQRLTEPKGEYQAGDVRTSTMVVTKVYKGGVKVGQELKFGTSIRTDCRWILSEKDIGNAFLLYLDPPQKTYFGFDASDVSEEPLYKADFCTRSIWLKEARDDLAYLENPKVRGRTRLSGKVSAPGIERSNLSNLRIDIKGNAGAYTADVKNDGFFEIYDLPAGEYVITIRSPIGWRVLTYSFDQIDHDHRAIGGRIWAEGDITVTIRTGRHSSLDLHMGSAQASRSVRCRRQGSAVPLSTLSQRNPPNFSLSFLVKTFAV
jgi:hypothetical protein